MLASYTLIYRLNPIVFLYTYAMVNCIMKSFSVKNFWFYDHCVFVNICIIYASTKYILYILLYIRVNIHTVATIL